MSGSVHKLLGFRKKAPEWLWHDDFSSLHPSPPEGSIHEEDAEQSYASFLNMGRRSPNLKGTGRHKLGGLRDCIAILPIGDVAQGTVDAASDIVSAFFSGYLSVQCLPSLCLRRQKKNGEVKILAKEKCFRALKCRFASGCRGLTKFKPIEVFSLFDVLVDFVEYHHVSVLAIVSSPLVEEGESSVFDVLGRACGDRVACVSTIDSVGTKVDLKSLCVTALHELLHTIGIDHAVYFRCLMNSQQPEYAEELISLCPLNLRKILLVLEEGAFITRADAEDVALSRYKKLLGVFEQYGFASDRDWVEIKIKKMMTIKRRARKRKRKIA